MATNISFPTYGFVNEILALSEDNWRTFFKPFITDSVQNGLATIAGANMTVYVSAGECRCGAVMGILDEMVALDIANGDSTYDRIDSVIIQYTYGEPSTLAVAIVQGTPSANPVPPTLTKVYDTLWQMEIAQILVPSGATSSSEFTITDKRVIYESIESIIDDNTESEERVWSSQKSREEIVSLSTEIYNSLNTKADVIERTVSGDIVTITDGADNIPVKELVVGIDPVQDLHGYDNPWPAGGGKNLIDPDTLINGYYDANGNAISSASYRTTPLIPVSPNTTYSGSFFDKSKTRIGALVFTFWDANENFISQASVASSVTTTAETAYVRIRTLQAQISYIENDNFLLYAEQGSSSNTFSPYSNICPISGHTSAVVTRTGKNLLEYRSALVPGYSETINGVTFTVNSDYSIKAVGTATTNANFELCYPSDGVRRLQGKTVYIWDKGGSSDTKCIFALYAQYYGSPLYANGGSPQTIGTQVRATLHIGTGQTVNYTFYPMVSFSVPDNTFELYQPFQTVTINLGEERYGGVLDVLTGQMRVDRGIVYLKDLKWTLNASVPHAFDSSISDRKSYANATSVSSKNISNIYAKHSPKQADADGLAHFSSGFAFAVHTNLKNKVTYVKDDRVSTVEEAVALFTTESSYIVYELATPLTVQLTPSQLSTLLGTNHIFASTGDTSVEYRADSKLFIDEQITESQIKTRQMITIVADQMIAPDNLSTNDIVVVNDELYKATANIASGEAMVIGTNVIKITLAEYIQSLL